MLGLEPGPCACHASALLLNHTPSLFVLVVVGLMLHGDKIIRTPIWVAWFSGVWQIYCILQPLPQFHFWTFQLTLQYPCAPLQSVLVSILDNHWIILVCVQIRMFGIFLHILKTFTFLTYWYVFKAHLYYGMYQVFIPFHLNSLPNYEWYRLFCDHSHRNLCVDVYLYPSYIFKIRTTTGTLFGLYL